MPYYRLSLYRYWFVYEAPPVRMLEFIVGILLARVVMSGQWIRIGFAPAAVLAIADYYLVVHVNVFYSFAAVSIIPIVLLIGSGADADIRGKTTWGLRSRAMVWLGEISFAFYMIHWIIVYYGQQLIGANTSWDTPTALGMIALGLALSILASWALHEWVEKPIMRNWSRPRRARVEVAEPTALAKR
jgi:peptidoglycan/LPS O-acetylase OafA/YrhL